MFIGNFIAKATTSRQLRLLQFVLVAIIFFEIGLAIGYVLRGFYNIVPTM